MRACARARIARESLSIQPFSSSLLGIVDVRGPASIDQLPKSENPRHSRVIVG